MKENLIVKTGVKWGLIYGVASIILTFASFQFMNPAETSAMSVIVTIASFAIMIGIVVMALREYRQLNYGSMSLGQGFKTGFILFAISSVIGSVFNFIYFKFIDPEMTDKMIDATMSQLEENPAMTEQTLEFVESMYASMFSAEGQLLIGIIGSLVVGAIVSLIIAAIMKRDAPNGGFQETMIDEIGQND